MSDPNAQVKRRQTILIVSTVLGILGLMGVGMFFFDTSGRAVREKPHTVNITPPGSVEDKDLWRTQQAASERANADQIGEMRSLIKSMDERMKSLETQNRELKMARPAVTKADPAVLREPLPHANTRVLNPPNGPSSSAGTLNQPVNNVAPMPPRRELELIAFKATTAAANAKGGAIATSRSAGDTNKVEFIPAGSFIRATMLNGVDAPTGGQADPHPIFFHLLDLANLPNRHRLDIRDCRVVGAATGDISSERTIVRLETLSCVLGNGETVDMPVKGHAIGEDGKVGIRGRFVSKQGIAVGNGILAGIAAGIGKAFNQSAAIVTPSALGTSQTIDPDKVSRAALGSGIANGFDRLADYYTRIADKLFPVIETDGGRIVELAFTKGAIYSGPADIGGTRYAALLQRNGMRSDDDDE